MGLAIDATAQATLIPLIFVYWAVVFVIFTRLDKGDRVVRAPTLQSPIHFADRAVVCRAAETAGGSQA
jgi:hypothetical protein